MTNTRRILLVEGKDDWHVVSSLMNSYDVPEDFKIVDTDGVNGLLSRLPVQLKATGAERIGIVLDADVDLELRWQSIRVILERHGYSRVPAVPSANGTILAEESYPQFGAWLMPDNSLPGMLEDFAALLIPADDPLKGYANSSIDGLPRRLFLDVHRPKVLIHTWLAWQSDPGTPMGLAITKKYLDANSGGAIKFVNWIKALFLD